MIPIYHANGGNCGIGAGFLPAEDQRHGHFSDTTKWTNEIHVDGKLLVGELPSMPSLNALDAYRIETPIGGPPFPDPYAMFMKAQLLGFVNRPNFRFKRLYETLLADFMVHHSNPSFGYGTAHPCAAIHVRHGDKLTELAHGYQDRITFNHSGLEYVAKAKEFGQHYSADIRTIFVMTDDVEVIEDLNRVHEDIRFLYVDSQRQKASDLMNGAQHDILGIRAGKNATVSFGELFLALQLASQCQYIVVNTGSSISELLLAYACLNQESCPKVYDFRK
jgi:hypothetical protein